MEINRLAQKTLKVPYNICINFTKSIALFLSALWYLAMVPSETVRNLLQYNIGGLFNEAGAFMYGGAPLKDLQQYRGMSAGSEDFLSSLGFGLLSVVVFLMVGLLWKSNLSLKWPHFALILLRLVGLGFAVALVVTSINTAPLNAFLAVVQWLLLSIVLLPMWTNSLAPRPSRH